MRKRRIPAGRMLLWLMALGWVALLFVLSGQDGAASSALSRRAAGLVLRFLPFLEMTPAALEPLLRKIAHAAVFAAEGFLLMLAAGASFGRGRGAGFSMLACGGMAVLNELHQRSAAGRSCEARDMLIDFGGALAGMLLALALTALVRRRRNVIC